jgi:hypothetical protein
MPYRYVEILRDDIWTRDEFQNVRAGDIYKLYEPNGTLIGIRKAVSNPEPCAPDGNWILTDMPYLKKE